MESLVPYTDPPSTGTMTGGGTRVIKGKMSSRMQSDYTPEQVLKLKEKLETEEKSYDVSSIDGWVGVEDL